MSWKCTSCLALFMQHSRLSLSYAFIFRSSTLTLHVLFCLRRVGGGPWCPTLLELCRHHFTFTAGKTGFVAAALIEALSVGSGAFQQTFLIFPRLTCFISLRVLKLSPKPQNLRTKRHALRQRAKRQILPTQKQFLEKISRFKKAHRSKNRIFFVFFGKEWRDRGIEREKKSPKKKENPENLHSDT